MENVELIKMYNAINVQLKRMGEPEEFSVAMSYDGAKTTYKYSLFSVGEDFSSLVSIINLSNVHVNPNVLVKTLELNIDFLLEKEVSDGKN